MKNMTSASRYDGINDEKSNVTKNKMTSCSVGTTNCDRTKDGITHEVKKKAENLIRSPNDTVLGQTVPLR